MEYFQIHFFREKIRILDVEAILEFFEVIEGVEIDMDERSVRINYVHPQLKYTARFLIMPKSQVKDIYRLNPRYLDLNFQLELPLMVPDYFAEKIFHFVKKLVEKFDYFVYHDYFEDVLPFKQDLIMKIFTMIKSKYLEIHPKYLTENHLISKEKLNSILRYLDDNFSLQKYYQDQNTYVPHYMFFTGKDNNLKIGIEWKYNSLTVIPPYVDYLFINYGNSVSIISYNEFYEYTNKLLEDVPGFLKGTKVTPKKNIKKINKILKKNKFLKIEDLLTNIDYFRLID